jgi:transposase
MEYYTAIGVDVSDRTSKICVMTKIGGSRRIVEETTVATTREGFSEYLANKSRDWPVTFETGVHCRWMANHIRGMGFKVHVANPAKLRQLTESNTKNDANDARELARYTLADVELLHPVFLRDEPYQQMIRLLKARTALVRTRTKLISEMRGFAKSMGFRIPKRDAGYFHLIDRRAWPKDLESLCWPLMGVLETIAIKIKAIEKQMHELADSDVFKSDVERVRQVFGVGFFCSAAFVAFLGGNYARFAKARDVGPYLGLVPRQDQSGDVDKQLPITKAGSTMLRTLLTECAQVVLKDSAMPTDLKLKGERIQGKKSANSRKRAVTAVVRGLAVTMLALLKHPEREYRPLSDSNRRLLEHIAAEREAAAGEGSRVGSREAAEAVA